MSELAVRGIEDSPMTSDMIAYIATTEIIPKSYRGRPAAIAAAMLLGRDLGMAPMEALLRIDVIDGKPSPSSEWMVSRIMEAGHVLYPTEQTDRVCTVVGKRLLDGVVVAESAVTFTWEQAERAGLAKKSNWKNYPEAMLFWRAAAQLARQFFPDCLGGVRYLADELGSDVPPDAPVSVNAEIVDTDTPPDVEAASTPQESAVTGDHDAQVVTRSAILTLFSHRLQVDEWQAAAYLDRAVEDLGLSGSVKFSRGEANDAWLFVSELHEETTDE